MGIAPGPVSAAGTCGTIGGYGLGHTTEVGTSPYITGASAVATNESGDVCSGGETGKYNFTFSGVAVQDNPSGDNGGIVASGFITYDGSDGTYFTTSISDPYCPQTKEVYSGNPIDGNVSAHYWVVYASSISAEQLKVNGDVYQTTNCDITTEFTQPMQSSFNSTVAYLASDVQGLSTSKVHLTSMQNQVNGSWTGDATLPNQNSYNQNSSNWAQTAIETGNGNGNEWYSWTSNP